MKPGLVLCLALILSGVCHAAITYPKAPEGGRPMVAENTGRTLRSDPGFLGGSRLEDLSIAEPYRNYGVGLTDLAAGRFLMAAKTGAWTYLLLHGASAVGAADLFADEKTGKALKFASLNRAFVPDAPLSALRMAEKLPQVKRQNYEVRFLKIAPILFTAVWLHGESDDIIIPLGDTFGRWNAFQPYSESQMLKLLKPEAKKKLKEPPGMLD